MHSHTIFKRKTCPTAWSAAKQPNDSKAQSSTDTSTVTDQETLPITPENTSFSTSIQKSQPEFLRKKRSVDVPWSFKTLTLSKNPPQTPADILSSNNFSLTEHERQEIWSYPEIYFFGKDAKKLKRDLTDEEGFYKARIADHIAYRYEIVSILGKGAFSEVFNCLDHKSGTHFAIKILRNNDTFNASGEEECRILSLIKSEKFPDKGINFIVDHFIFRDHICIVLEKLKENLHDFQNRLHFRRIPIDLVRVITKQILRSLCFIHKLDLIHCDLKPDNLMFRESEIPEIEVIDFNSACENSRRTADYVQSRPYRAPEIVVDLEYSNKIDMWSLGCIVIEMITGEQIFKSDSEQDLFRKYVEVCGHPKRELLCRGRRCGLFVDRLGKVKVKVTGKVKSVEKLLNGFGKDVVGFVERLVTWDPMERMTAQEALEHEWIRSYL